MWHQIQSHIGWMNVVEYINYVVFLVGDIYKLRCLIRFKVFTIIYLLYTFFLMPQKIVAIQNNIINYQFVFIKD